MMIRPIMATVIAALLLPAPLLAVPSPSDCLQAPAAPELKAPPDPWLAPRGVPYVKALGADPAMQAVVYNAPKKVKGTPPAQRRRCPTK